MQRRIQLTLLTVAMGAALFAFAISPVPAHADFAQQATDTPTPTETPTPTVTPTPSPTPNWIWVATLEASGNTLIVERRFTFGDAAVSIAALLVVGVLLLRWAWDIAREAR